MRKLPLCIRVDDEIGLRLNGFMRQTTLVANFFVFCTNILMFYCQNMIRENIRRLERMRQNMDFD